MKYYIGIDLGGTNIAAGVIDSEYNLIAKEVIATNAAADPLTTQKRMCELAKKTAKSAGIPFEQISSIGVGVPGTANQKTGIVEFACNVGFINEPVVKNMSALLKKPVFIENDANAAALAEFVCTADKKCKNLVLVTLGTGVGGGVVIDGKLFRGSNFAGAELGHIVIKKDGRECGCKRKGCFETYASATGLVNTTKEFMIKDQSSKLWEISGGLDGVDGKTAFDAMRLNDKTATAVINQYINDLSCGITNIVNIFQPDILCIGGGISAEGETLLKPLREKVALEQYARYSDKKTFIKKASLSNDAGIIGAALSGLY